jgi:hypothetical protein
MLPALCTLMGHTHANLRQSLVTWAELISNMRLFFRLGDVVRDVTNISMKENIKIS